MDLLSQKWSDIYNFTDVNYIASEITRKLTKILDLHIPRSFKIIKNGKKKQKNSAPIAYNKSN